MYMCFTHLHTPGLMVTMKDLRLSGFGNLTLQVSGKEGQNEQVIAWNYVHTTCI